MFTFLSTSSLSFYSDWFQGFIHFQVVHIIGFLKFHLETLCSNLLSNVIVNQHVFIGRFSIFNLETIGFWEAEVFA